MNSWYLEETRIRVQRLHGKGQLDLANPSIRSVADRQTYAHLHYRDAKAKINSYLKDWPADKLLIDVSFGDDVEGWHDFNVFIREVGAYLTACVQSIHAIPDLISYAIYYCLRLNRTSALRPRAVGVGALKLELAAGGAELANLHSLLIAMVDEPSYGHVAALANQAKHRSIVSPSLNEDWTGSRQERHQVVFPAFCYEGRSYRELPAFQVLAAGYEHCVKHAVALGTELNSVLGRRN